MFDMRQSIGGSSYQKYVDLKNNPSFYNTNYEMGSNFCLDFNESVKAGGGVSEIDKTERSSQYPKNFRDSNTLNQSMVSFSDF